MASRSGKPARSDSPLFNMSLHKGIDVLMSFGPKRPDMNLSEIADATGLNKSSAQRFAYTLEALGFLRKDARTKRFSLTVKTVELGYRYLLVNRLLESANPYLLDLNQRCGETVNLAEPEGTDMVYVARFATSQRASVHMPVGRRLPMFCTSAGRAILSALPPEQAYELLKSSPRPKYTPDTITDIDKLMGLLEETREQGYSYSGGEYYRGDLNISLPILNARGVPLAAINISAPNVRWTPDRLKRELVPELIETGRLISTTPPSPRDVEPFREGYGTSTKLLNIDPQAD